MPNRSPDDPALGWLRFFVRQLNDYRNLRRKLQQEKSNTTLDFCVQWKAVQNVAVDTIKTRRHKLLISLIRAERITAGLRQQDVAKRCDGRSQQWIALVESGQRRIDVVEYLMLADAIGFDPYSLLAKVAKAK